MQTGMALRAEMGYCAAMNVQRILVNPFGLVLLSLLSCLLAPLAAWPLPGTSREMPNPVREAVHRLEVRLEPETSTLRGRDRIDIRMEDRDRVVFFLSPEAAVDLVRAGGAAAEHTFRDGWLEIVLPEPRSGNLRVEIGWSCVFNDPVPENPVAFDNPGFGVTGVIDGRGAFLLPGSGWHPDIRALQASFDVTVDAPEGIFAVTDGSADYLGPAEDRPGRSLSRWKVDNPGRGLPLAAGRYHMDSRMADKTRIMTFLSEQNAPLAGRYLQAAASHVLFYKALHGPYPFSKFAVVENFFPTGYGFPSFTLLGGRVIRLPFIPETSLRHEVAHCWWGNGVLVDYRDGNWSEGLTTYVADYLAREMEGAGEARDYRLQVLRDYALLAASQDDLPLSEFGARTSPATRAVGYGKSMFVFHMARSVVGDKPFWEGLRRVYAGHLFREAAWEDFRLAFVSSSDWDDAASRKFFEQWIRREGAPKLALRDVRVMPVGEDGYRLTGVVAQNRPHYALRLPIRVRTEGRSARTVLEVSGGLTAFSMEIADRPVSVAVDPDANVFRLLGPGEIPATVNSVKGADRVAAILSSDLKSNGIELSTARALAGTLLTGLGHPRAPILEEKDLERLAPGTNPIFIGYPGTDRARELLSPPPTDAQIGPDRFRPDSSRPQESPEPGRPLGAAIDTAFAVLADPDRPRSFSALLLPLGPATPQTLETAIRKLTHYGRYSYLGFRAGENRIKGVWPGADSPLEQMLETDGPPAGETQ